MKKHFLKLAAGVLSVVLALSCFGTIRGSANEIVKPLAGQSLGYITDVKKDGTMLNFNLRFTGIDDCSNLIFRVFYDNTKLSIDDTECDYDGRYSMQSILAKGNNGIVAISLTRAKGSNLKGDFTVTLPFHIQNGKSAPFKFTTELKVYTTHSGYSFAPSIGEEIEDISVSSTAHLVGDVDKSGAVNILDVSAALTILSATNQNAGATDTNQYYTSVVNYNEQRLDNKKLLASDNTPKYNCGVAIDIDNDGIIDFSDAQAIFDYDSCRNANAPLPNNGVGTTRNTVCYH